MPFARLLRNADTVFGVFGYLEVLSDVGGSLGRFCTAEEDWNNNIPRQSCIPPGRYLCKLRWSHKFQRHLYEITNVPGRGDILFHWGNTEKDVEGCVLVGSYFGALNVKDEDDPLQQTRQTWAVLESKPTFEKFMAILSGIKEFRLDVSWATPGSWRR